MNNMSIVISIENLWKEYYLGVIGHGTLTHDLQSLWAKIRKREDPNSQIVPISDGQKEQVRGKRFWALRNVWFEVKEGEVLGIIGKNGAGKSTLLKILSRVTAPTVGKIKIKGRIASLLEVGTGFHPELTGKENVFMNGSILGMSRKEIKNRLEEIIEFSGVGKFVDTPVKRYSSGMHVRLAFSVAAHLEPEILLIDEVLAVGDVEFQQKCLGKMEDVASKGRTVLFVSHNMGTINRLCGSCICLESGSVSKTGDPADVIAHYYNQNNKNLDAEKLWGIQEKNPGYGTGVNILSVKICQPHNCVISNIKINQPVEIQIELEVEKATPEFAIHVKIKRYDGLVLIHSNDMIPNDDFGRVRTTLKIPKYAMNLGDYYVDIAADIPNKTILFMEELCLKFSVISNSNRMSIYTEGNNKGVLGPFIGDWSRS